MNTHTHHNTHNTRAAFLRFILSGLLAFLLACPALLNAQTSKIKQYKHTCMYCGNWYVDSNPIGATTTSRGNCTPGHFHRWKNELVKTPVTVTKPAAGTTQSSTGSTGSTTGASSASSSSSSDAADSAATTDNTSPSGGSSSTSGSASQWRHTCGKCGTSQVTSTSSKPSTAGCSKAHAWNSKGTTGSYKWKCSKCGSIKDTGLVSIGGQGPNCSKGGNHNYSIKVDYPKNKYQCGSCGRAVEVAGGAPSSKDCPTTHTWATQKL